MVARLKPARIEHVVDGLRLRAQLSAIAASEGADARPAVKDLLHGALFRGRMIAKERLEAGENGLAVARLLAKVADEVVSALFDYTTTHLFRARNPTYCIGLWRFDGSPKLPLVSCNLTVTSIV